MIEIGRIVDEMPASGAQDAASGPLAKATGCPGPGAMWRYAAGWDSGGEGLMSPLADLPPGLRRLMGQRLAGVALMKGNTDLARDVLDLLDRTPGTGGADEAVLREALDLFEGRADPSAFASVDGGKGERRNVLALVLYSRAVLGSDGATPPALIEALAQVERISRGTDQGLEVHDLRLKLIARSGDLMPALAELEAGRTYWPDAGPSRDALALRLIAEADLSSVSAADAAKVALTHVPSGDVLSGNTDAVLNLARKLETEGLPNLARDLLQARGPGLAQAPRLLLARTALADALPDRALALLEGMTGPEPDALRLEVHLRRGAFPQALRVARRLDDPETPEAHLALLARDWDAGRMGAEGGSPVPLLDLVKAPPVAVEETPEAPLTGPAPARDASDTLTPDMVSDDGSEVRAIAANMGLKRSAALRAAVEQTSKMLRPALSR